MITAQGYSLLTMESLGHCVFLSDAHTGRRTFLSGLQRTDLVDLATLDHVLGDGWQRGWHAFAWLPYDLGEAHLGVRGSARGAVFWFEAREEGPDVHLEQGEGWLADVRPDLDEEEFAARIADVHEAIAAGTTYQVNFTHRVTDRFAGDPVELYRRLFERQPVAYGVLAHLPEPAAPWTLSLSPELFVRVDDGVATTQPMKGTAPADTDPEALRSDPKNRAENLMIVDLLRNDLSQVAVPGTVDVPALFEVEQVGQLWQMTSTVRAELLPGTTPSQLLAATFPCGSITGAPKLAAMELIRRLERDPRGLYTGSLGLIEPGDGPVGWRATLSVAIRTLELDPDASGHNARLGIGSGVVSDSTAQDEWAECLAKAAFARGAGPTVDLIETMRVIDGAAPLAARHQARLDRSTAELGFAPVDGLVQQAIGDTPPGQWRVRLQVAADGSAEVTRAPLDVQERHVRIVLAADPWGQGHVLGRHKTTARAHLNQAIEEAVAVGAFDSIGHDVHGNVLEGGRTSVFARIDGRWVTPPLHLGILDGVQRAEILANPGLLGADRIEEDPFTVADLRRAEAIVVTNAVHGLLPATLEPPA